MGPTFVLALCALLGAAVVLWIAWRVLLRLSDPKVSKIEKLFAAVLVIAGGAICVVVDPVLGVPVIGGGIAALARKPKSGGAAGVPAGGDGGGGGC